MNPNDVSSLPLRDIHLPGPIGWWPPAVGWWLLAALVLVALALYALRYYQSRHRRVALKSLQRVRAALEQGVEPVVCLQNVSTVLRRFAMTTAAARDRKHEAAVEAEVPGLIGQRWLAYLDSRWQRDEFAQGAGRALLAAPYARPNSIDRAAALELTALCAEWLGAQHATPRARPRRASGG
jgi:DNA polymerase III gamma/tau subunit